MVLSPGELRTLEQFRSKVIDEMIGQRVGGEGDVM